MSTFCGIVDFSYGGISFEKLKNMGDGMAHRGESARGAYLWRGASLMEARAARGVDVLPASVECGGRRYVVSIDGRIENLSEFVGVLGIDDGDEATLVAACYARYGRECVKHFRGEFALIIYDELYRELFFAVDSRGTHSVYYYFDGASLVFASEIKGILRYIGEGAEIYSTALCEHIMSDGLMLRSDEIYRGIYELPPSHYALFSPLGLQITQYRAWGGEEKREETVLRLPDVSHDLRSCLYSSLMAFDYPCFDEYICPLVSFLEGQEGEKSAAFFDRLLSLDAKYSIFRAERLGRRYGAHLTPVESKRLTPTELLYLYKTEKKLSDASEELFAGGRLPHPIFSRKICDDIGREKSIARKIRSYGKLLQSVMWLESYRVIPV